MASALRALASGRLRGSAATLRAGARAGAGRGTLGPRPIGGRLRLLRLALRGPRPVHGRRGDPLRGVFRPPALLLFFLDVLVLALALVAPGLPRHAAPPARGRMQAACSRAVTVTTSPCEPSLGTECER